jgi:ATP-dependent RNA helicase DHX29
MQMEVLRKHKARAQGGRAGAAAFARKHVLGTATLEMLADMRQQFARMLADIGFVAGPGRGERAAKGPAGSSGGKAPRCWADERKAAWNQHAAKPAVVRACVSEPCRRHLLPPRPLHA